MSQKEYVAVVKSATGEPQKVMGPMSFNKAHRVYMGLLRQIDTDKYHVASVEECDLPKKWEKLLRPSPTKPN